MKTVILFYKYVPIEDPIRFQKEQLKLCSSLGMKGRIIIASEGINGTASGDTEAIDTYKKTLWKDSRFSDMVFKESFCEDHAFKKLSIKVRDEIVSLKQNGVDFAKGVQGGKYIEPDELYKIITKNTDEYYIIDVRNNYESAIGKFKDSIALDIGNFRELPEGMKQIEHLKEKKVITVCTGGIRCEKATAYLISQGFQDVSQLHGGIVTYGKLHPDDGFEGKCYVFDARVSVDINTPEHKKIISNCLHCDKAEDRYVNCCNAACNKQFVCCEMCEQLYEGGCSQACQEKSRYKDSPIVA